ncbi:DsrE family protein [Shewanella cyperi]|nr:DsrE family protein [Shewanella cyperi]
MMQGKLLGMAAIVAALLAPGAAADGFRSGPVIEGFGKVAYVKQTFPVAKDQHFKVVFDTGEQGKEGDVNRTLDSMARFLNMHGAAGVPLENIQLALVLHGKAAWDALTDDAHQRKLAKPNPNSVLLQALLDKGARIIVCGQTAAYLGIDNNMLAPGVEMSLSAMTAHAQLAQQGYSLNPF